MTNIYSNASCKSSQRMRERFNDKEKDDDTNDGDDDDDDDDDVFEKNRQSTNIQTRAIL